MKNRYQGSPNSGLPYFYDIGKFSPKQGSGPSFGESQNFPNKSDVLAS